MTTGVEIELSQKKKKRSKRVNLSIVHRKLILLLTDIILINISGLTALLLRFDFSIPSEFLQTYLEYWILTTFIMIITFYGFNLYQSVWRYASLDELVYVVFSSVVGSAALFFMYNFILNIKFPRSFYVLFMILSISLVGGIRFTYRAMRRIKLALFKDDLDRKRVLIIGGGKAGSIMIKEMYNNPQIHKYPVAVIDDDPQKYKRKIHGVPILGTRADINRIVEEKKIDEILIAMPAISKAQIKEIVSICSKTKCNLKTLPGVYELIDGRVDIKKIRDIQIEDLLGRDPIKVDLKEISGYLTNEVVLVTGGGGSIGSELCRQIAGFSPKKLIIFDIYENSAYEIQQELIRKHGNSLNLEVIIGSVRDKNRLEQIFKNYKPQVVFHAAAHKHVPLMESSPMEAIKNNVFGTMNVAECADKYSANRFVLISTDKAVNPTNIMGATKRIAEMIVQAIDKKSKTEFVAVRFGNVLGSNGSVIPLFRKQILEGGPVTVTDPEIIRYFMTIPEAVQLVIQAGAMAEGGEIFVLDMGDPVKIADLARDLIKLSGFEPDVDIKIEYTGLRPGEKLYEELLMAEEGLIETKHEKIFIGKPVSNDIEQLRKDIEMLKAILFKEDMELIDVVVKKLVPGYKKVS
ncbi:nucleoside-diphosphate sugar epimerase/dehydratase [Alkaliphilus sp. B6464]|uniref:nucleoside-diphosphate sugar epimerase/dehydratase n=1 Tax=Alkaliphilus sp. B6464 TaxID=2731219 RepID=UPI001BAD0F43|nr:nucleoside-diphosphate sugar epimerase/dehydratase [Alkaliphilus sp. B6464]QUH19072.1 polysaccharide biosynthesis protein [Alkaliphilus sp. B6464]